MEKEKKSIRKNFRFTPTTIRELDALAEKKRLEHTEVIERIIEELHKRECQ